MSRQINVSDSVYEKLKERKKGKSFSILIEKMLEREDGIVSADEIFRNSVITLKERIDKLDKFVSSKSGGDY